MNLDPTICNRPDTNFVQNLYHRAGVGVHDRVRNVPVGEVSRGVEATLDPHPEDEFARVPTSLQERDGRLKEVDPETWTAA